MPRYPRSPFKKVSNVISPKVDGNSLDIPTGRSATLTVAANDSSAISKQQADYVCDGTDDDVLIQASLDALSIIGGTIQLMEGTFITTSKITKVDYSNIIGCGINSTIFDVSGIGTEDVIELGDYSSLNNLKISGDISSLPTEFTQQVIPGNFCALSSIWITDTAYGFECKDKTDVSIDHVKFTNIRDVEDWAACIHAADASRRIWINDFHMEACNRGIEVEDGSQWVKAENGYMKNIQNYNGTGHEAFSMDVHMHSGGVPVKHIIYRNIYAEDTYPPQSRILGTYPSGKNDNILFEDIQLVSTNARTILQGDNITMRNVNGIELTRLDIANHIIIEDCECGGYSGNPGWEILDATDVTIQNCEIRAHAVTPDHGILINHASATDIRILNNDFESSNFISAVNVNNALSGIIISGNKVDPTVPLVTDASKLSTIGDNIGYVNRSSGTATLVNGTTSIAVTHGLSVTPGGGDIIVTPIESWGNMTQFYIGTWTSTQFTIYANINPGQDVDFAWKAIVL